MDKDIESLFENLNQSEIIKKAPVFKFANFSASPFKVIISTVLSARTRDEVTIDAVNRLFDKFDTVGKLARSSVNEIAELIKPVGFYRQKAKYIKEIAIHVLRHGLPRTYDELILLPGVGRKTANIILSYVYGWDVIAVDTHVHRISNRIGIVKTRTTLQTEKELMKRIPQKYWKRINLLFVALGQMICRKKPHCSICPINNHCDYFISMKTTPQR